MVTGSGRKWLLNAFIIFLPGVFLWILAVLWAASYSEGKFDFFSDLNSQLLADYSPDSFGQSMKSLKLAIFGDVFSDSSASSEEIVSLELAMQGLVPTATLEHSAFLLTLTPMTSSTQVAIPITNPTLSPSATPTPVTTKLASSTTVPTPTMKVPSATPARQRVVPILDCVANNEDGTFTAHFSYKNYNS